MKKRKQTGMQRLGALSTEKKVMLWAMFRGVGVSNAEAAFNMIADSLEGKEPRVPEWMSPIVAAGTLDLIGLNDELNLIGEGCHA